MKALVHDDALRSGTPTTLRSVFETLERIEINILEEKAAMGFLKREDKIPEKVNMAKVAILAHTADASPMCFTCGKSGHRRRNCKEGKTSTPQAGGFCLGCGIKGHAEPSCWKVHPELKPSENK